MKVRYLTDRVFLIDGPFGGLTCEWHYMAAKQMWGTKL